MTCSPGSVHRVFLTAKLGGIFICPVRGSSNLYISIYLSLLVNRNGLLRGDEVKERVSAANIAQFFIVKSF